MKPGLPQVAATGLPQETRLVSAASLATHAAHAAHAASDLPLDAAHATDATDATGADVNDSHKHVNASCILDLVRTRCTLVPRCVIHDHRVKTDRRIIPED